MDGPHPGGDEDQAEAGDGPEHGSEHVRAHDRIRRSRGSRPMRIMRR